MLQNGYTRMSSSANSTQIWCFTEQMTNRFTFRQCQLDVALECTKDLYWYLAGVRERAKAIRGIYVFRQWPPTPTHPLLSLRSRWLTLQPPNSELLLTPAVSSVYVCVIAKKEIICAPRLSRWYSDGKNLFWKGCVDISLWCYFCSLPVSSYDAGYDAFQTWGNAKWLTTYEKENLYVRVRERWSPILLCVMLLLPAFGALFSQTRRTIFPCQYHHGCRCYMRRGREEPNE